MIRKVELMKKFRIFLTVLCVMLAMTALAVTASAAGTVYLKDGGIGDGSSAAAPLGDLADAMSALPNGGTVVLSGDYTLKNSANYDAALPSFTAPATNGTITITSQSGGRLIFNSGARFFLTGNTVFKNVTLYNADGKTTVMAARFFELTFDEGCVMDNFSEFIVVGGMEHTNETVGVPDEDYSKDTHVTLRSGTFAEIVGLGRNVGRAKGKAVYTGTANLTIGGTAEVKKVFGCYRWGSAAETNGKANITLDGGSVGMFITACGAEQHAYTCDVNVKITENMIPANYFTLKEPGWGSDAVWYGLTAGGAYGTVALNYGTTKLDLSSAKNVTDEWLKSYVYLDSFGTVISYGQSGTVIKMTIGDMNGYVNGVAKKLDAAPIIRQDRTMLPVRFVAENLGATVGWVEATSTATLTCGDIEIKITIGAKTATVNGVEKPLDAPAFIENSRTYLPVRFVAEALGAAVAWDGATSTATLTK